MDAGERRPDFFIVGAPKCGTTSLFEYLNEHPQVFLAPKEVHFFGSDLYPAQRPRDEAKYLRLFSPATNEARVGEASVWYLYSKRAAREIRRFSPAASIIISLRNPVEMIHSLHSHFVFSGLEEIEEFEDAIRAETERGRSLPLWGSGRVATETRYLEVGKYCEQVERYLDEFGSEKVKIIIFDDLRENPPGVFREVCEFLGVSPEFEPHFRIANPNKRVRSKGLRAFMSEPPAPFKAVGRLVTSPGGRQKLLDRLQRLNARHVPRPPMPRSLREHLQSYFAPDVARLSELVGRDLNHWCHN
jgi:hypothetical protein